MSGQCDIYSPTAMPYAVLCAHNQINLHIPIRCILIGYLTSVLSLSESGVGNASLMSSEVVGCWKLENLPTWIT